LNNGGRTLNLFQRTPFVILAMAGDFLQLARAQNEPKPLFTEQGPTISQRSLTAEGCSLISADVFNARLHQPLGELLMIRLQRFSAGAALALALSVAAGAAQAQTVFRINGWLPPTHPIMTRTLKPWADEVAAATQGRVRFEVTASTLGPPPTQIDMVKDGIVEAVFSVHGYTPQRFTLARVGELPFLSDLSEPLSVALWRVTEKHFAARDEHAGMQLLALWAAQPGRVWTSKKPLKTMADWNGIKLAGGAAINVDIAKALGGVGIRAPGPQAAEMVRRGVTDGLFIDASSFTDFSLQGTIRHMLDFPKGMYSATFFFGVNKARWNQLSQADRDAILKLSGERLSAIAGRNWDAEAAKSRENVKAAGVEVTMASGTYLAELENALRSFEEDWLKAAQGAGVDSKAALADLKSIINSYK